MIMASNPISNRTAITAGVLWSLAATALIAATASRLDAFPIIGPTGLFQYAWRLSTPQTTARVTAWLGYGMHNLAAWLVIWSATGVSFSANFGPHNWAMLGIHTFFGLAHGVQTHLWYDGLAQDVHELTALGSVALMLIVVLVLEMPCRGLFCGKSIPVRRRFVQIVKQYHSYFCTWALIYNFWYHPMVGTHGHLAGFLYNFILLWQSVLLYHRSHLNISWRLSLELLVLPHSVFVAHDKNTGTTPMFVFGFLSVFVLTQMHGLGWSDRGRKSIYFTFVASMVAYYGYTNRWSKITEVLRIPAMDYGVVFLLYFLFLLVDVPLQIFRSLTKQSSIKNQ